MHLSLLELHHERGTPKLQDLELIEDGWHRLHPDKECERNSAMQQISEERAVKFLGFTM